MTNIFVMNVQNHLFSLTALSTLKAKILTYKQFTTNEGDIISPSDIFLLFCGNVGATPTSASYSLQATRYYRYVASQGCFAASAKILNQSLMEQSFRSTKSRRIAYKTYH